MTKAFVLIETAVGKDKEATNELRQLQGVKSVDTVTGPYDVILVAEVETLDDIDELVTAKIQPIPGISRTLTCLAM